MSGVAGRVALGVLLAVTLQLVIGSHLTVAGVVPDLLLVATVTVALASGSSAGAVAGFAAGVLADLIGSGPFGASMLVMTVVGYLAGSLQASLFAEGWLAPVTVVLTASLLKEAAYGLLLGVLGVGGPFWRTLARVVLPTAVYTTVVAVIVYPWVSRLLRRERSVATLGRL